MEKLIPIINKLHAVVTTVGTDFIDLPQIAVVGSQSSGKSSVLEAFVGRDFLPRGDGIVTRRPLILQLVHLDDKNAPETGKFLHQPNKVYTDFNEIMAEIVAETDRVTGGSRRVSTRPINLQIFSPNVLNLTVVDLPGLTKVAVEGQDMSIVEDIKNMVTDVVRRPFSLILAVTPANQDLATSDALLLARQVDPAGDRTIGVITKLDLMDRGTDAREALQNRVYPLKLGYIGVVNRSQSDLNRRLPLAAARKKEREFFEDKTCPYSDFADRCGSAYLVSTLNSLLMQHIRQSMPLLRQRVQTLLTEKEAELQGYGEDPSASRGTMNAFILEVITKYLDAYQNLMNGISTEELVSRGGARISRHFMDTYEPAIKAIPGLTTMDDKAVFFMMKNHAGLSVPLFTPHKAFDTMLFRAIEQLRTPSLLLIEAVVAILFEIHNQVEFMELTRFTALAEAIHGVVDGCIRSRVNPTQDYINGLIDNEKSFVNTARPDFRGSQVVNAPAAEDPRSRELPQKPPVPDPVGVCSIYGTSKEMTPHQSTEMKDLVQIGTKYFDLVKAQIMDLVPKAVVKFLVEESSTMLRPKMIETIFNTQDLSELLHEDSAITRKRVACQQIVDALRKATLILNEVRTFNAE
jgi:dynamin 1-like protein